jgi:hypothetical protein
VKVLLFVGTNFHAVILGFSNSWFQTLQATIDEEIVFRWILIFVVLVKHEIHEN